MLLPPGGGWEALLVRFTQRGSTGFVHSVSRALERAGVEKQACGSACEYFAVNALSSPRNTLNFPIHLRGH